MYAPEAGLNVWLDNSRENVLHRFARAHRASAYLNCLSGSRFGTSALKDGHLLLEPRFFLTSAGVQNV